jgi:hypothetical protein
MAGGRICDQITDSQTSQATTIGGMRMSKRFSTKFFTIGHAARPLAAFIELLSEVEIRLVVDVRTAPRSRTNPQFDRETLAVSLAAFGIEYRHIAALGAYALNRDRFQRAPMDSGKTGAFTIMQITP